MPVGCFPSFRKKIKKFNKGKAPLSKKEETNNDSPQNNVRQNESNNHVEAKPESPVKVVEHPVEDIPPAPKFETEQNQQPQESVNTADLPHEILKEAMGENRPAENAQSGEVLVECSKAGESILPQKHEHENETVPQTVVVPETFMCKKTEIPEVNENPCKASKDIESAVESTEYYELNIHLEKAKDQEAVKTNEDEHQYEITIDRVENARTEELKSQKNRESAEPERGDVEMTLTQEYPEDKEGTESTTTATEHIHVEEEKPEEIQTGEKQLESAVAEPERGGVEEALTQEHLEDKEGTEPSTTETEHIHFEGEKFEEVDETRQRIAKSLLSEPECAHFEESNFQETRISGLDEDSVLPKGFNWKLVSDPLPIGAININELHLPIYVGLVECCHGKIPCKYVEKNRMFYAGIDGREENFANGKILCLDPSFVESIELEWVHVSTPDIRSRNLFIGAFDTNGRPMYIARGMIPLAGPYPYYELSSGWASENLEIASLAFGGLEWKQHDFDVLAWKPRC